MSEITEYVDGYFRYTVKDSSVIITGYNGRETEVSVPEKIAGNPVNTIASGAFYNVLTVKTVNLPDTIMTIEEGAFAEGQTVVYNSNKVEAGDGSFSSVNTGTVVEEAATTAAAAGASVNAENLMLLGMIGILIVAVMNRIIYIWRRRV